MPLHIVLVAPPWYPVPPRGYGGIEVVVDLLVRELRARGHRVTLLAAAASGHDAVACAPAGWAADLGGPGERLRELEYAACVSRALESLDPVDLVHDHCGFGTLLGLSLRAGPPVVHTVHGPVDDLLHGYYGALRGRARLVAISDSQRDSAPDLPWIGRVHNAVDVDQLPPALPDREDPYLLCLARITEEKGQHLAVEVAREVGMRLVLAGKVDGSAAGRSYWEEEVRPRVDGSDVVHLENVHGEGKARLVAGATALLAPIQWEEPFGLSVVEAMAGGTPAISFRRGAAPEVIEEGVTGFLVDDAEGMVEAVLRVGEIDHQRCATAARERFGPRAMADGYLRVYERACSSA